MSTKDINTTYSLPLLRMAAGAKQRLMSELKDLEKEKWANIEVYWNMLTFAAAYAH